MTSPHEGASLEPFQARAVLHKQEPLEKWSQGKSRAHSCYKLVMDKRWGMTGALEVQGRRNVVAGNAEMCMKVSG